MYIQSIALKKRPSQLPFRVVFRVASPAVASPALLILLPPALLLPPLLLPPLLLVSPPFHLLVLLLLCACPAPPWEVGAYQNRVISTSTRLTHYPTYTHTAVPILYSTQWRAVEEGVRANAPSAMELSACPRLATRQELSVFPISPWPLPPCRRSTSTQTSNGCA